MGDQQAPQHDGRVAVWQPVSGAILSPDVTSRWLA